MRKYSCIHYHQLNVFTQNACPNDMALGGGARGGGVTRWGGRVTKEVRVLIKTEELERQSAVTALSEDWQLKSNTHIRHLRDTSNPSSKKVNILFWPSRVPTHIQGCMHTKT